MDALGGLKNLKMGKIKDIAIEIQELHHKLQQTEEKYKRLRAWFVSALLAGGGQLPTLKIE